MTTIPKTDETVMQIMGVPCAGLPPGVKMDYDRLYDSDRTPIKTVKALGLLAAYGDHTHPAYVAAANFIAGKAISMTQSEANRVHTVESDMADVTKRLHFLEKRAELLGTILRRAGSVTGLVSEFHQGEVKVSESDILDALFRAAARATEAIGELEKLRAALKD